MGYPILVTLKNLVGMGYPIARGDPPLVAWGTPFSYPEKISWRGVPHSREYMRVWLCFPP